jgi:hypothetical protein
VISGRLILTALLLLHLRRPSPSRHPRPCPRAAASRSHGGDVHLRAAPQTLPSHASQAYTMADGAAQFAAESAHASLRPAAIPSCHVATFHTGDENGNLPVISLPPLVLAPAR